MMRIPEEERASHWNCMRLSTYWDTLLSAGAPGRRAAPVQKRVATDPAVRAGPRVHAWRRRAGTLPSRPGTLVQLGVEVSQNSSRPGVDRGLFLRAPRRRRGGFDGKPLVDRA